jgi:hypothetical protein
MSVTVDRDLSLQQNLPSFSISVIVLHATSNPLAELRVLIPEPLMAIESAPVATIVQTTR